MDSRQPQPSSLELDGRHPFQLAGQDNLAAYLGPHHQLRPRHQDNWDNLVYNSCLNWLFDHIPGTVAWLLGHLLGSQTADHTSWGRRRLPSFLVPVAMPCRQQPGPGDTQDMPAAAAVVVAVAGGRHWTDHQHQASCPEAQSSFLKKI